MQNQLEEDINENKPVKEIIASVKDAVVKFHLQEHEVITSVRSYLEHVFNQNQLFLKMTL